ncbi:MAG: hypothetical protein BGO16_03110 [Nitrobacter sp. 62-23]|nr:MAG: hypothetical protein BGO16_03110 [Nitrobacter sp. 62-23]
MPIHPACQRSPTRFGISAAIFGNAISEAEPAASSAAAITKRVRRIKFFAIRKIASGEIFSMVITAAHIQPIVALIAGILILLMPRFLNFVIAIYLIFVGLQGLGVLKMLHL